MIGIGLNANLPREDFPPELAALRDIAPDRAGGARVDRSELARDLIRRLDHWYDLSRADGPETLNAAWCQRSEHSGPLGESRDPVRTALSVVWSISTFAFGVTLELQLRCKRSAARRLPANHHPTSSDMTCP